MTSDNLNTPKRNVPNNPIKSSPYVNDPGLRKALENFDRAAGSKGVADLSEDAVERLLDLHASYIDDLLVGAAQSSRRQKSDIVSKIDVEFADKALRLPRGSWVAELCTGTGGVFAGGGLSSLLSLWSTNYEGLSGYIIAMSSLVVGCSMLAFSFRR